MTPQVSPGVGGAGRITHGRAFLPCVSRFPSTVVGLKIGDDGRGEVLKLTYKESVTFTACSRGCWPLLSALASGMCAALLWGQRSRSRAARCELCIGPRGCAARVTYCWGWPGHGVPSVAEATAAGDALASADGAAPPKHALHSLHLFLFIFSTEQKTQTPVLSTGPTRTLPIGLRAHVSWWCRREVLRPRPDPGRVSRPQ